MRHVAPGPGSAASIATDPPWASAMARTIDRSEARGAGGLPTLEAGALHRRRSAAMDIRTVGYPRRSTSARPAGVCRIALSMTLPSACRMRAGSITARTSSRRRSTGIETFGSVRSRNKVRGTVSRTRSCKVDRLASQRQAGRPAGPGEDEKVVGEPGSVDRSLRPHCAAAASSSSRVSAPGVRRGPARPSGSQVAS